jgi:hypothetical protein
MRRSGPAEEVPMKGDEIQVTKNELKGFLPVTIIRHP